MFTVSLPVNLGNSLLCPKAEQNTLGPIGNLCKVKAYKKVHKTGQKTTK